MKQRYKIPLLVLGFLILLGLIFLTFIHKPAVAPTKNVNSQNNQSSQTPAPNLKGNEETFKNALNLYIQKKQGGLDMENGPCLGKIAEDWVLDIAHNPRQPVDDKVENQCAEYRQGQAHHFIELDPDGKLIQFK